MKIEILKEENSVVEFTINVTSEEVAPFYDEAFAKDVEKIEEDGFRKGKMPKNIFMKKYGKEALNPTIIDLILNKFYPQVIDDHNLNVVANPDFKWDTLKLSDDGFFVEGFVAVVPVLNLGDYQKIADAVKVEDAQVTDEDVEKEISTLLESYSEFEIKDDDELVENGDTVVLDFEGFVDGVAFEGGKSENHSLVIGSNSFIPGFEEQLIGLKINEEKDITVTFPEEYHSEELKGKESIFKINIHEIKMKKTPEMTDELIEEIDGYEAKTVSDFKAEVKTKLLETKVSDNKNKRIIEVFDKVIEDSNFVVPTQMISQETERTIGQFKQQITSQGMEYEMYLQMLGMTEEVLRADIDKESRRKIEEQLVVSEIVKKENITATDEEVNSKIEELVKMYSMEKEQLLSMVGGEENLKLEVSFEKAYNKLLGL